MPTKTQIIDAAYLASPPVTEAIGSGASRMVEDRGALVEVVHEEHNIKLTDASIEHGRHLPGSAVAYIAAATAVAAASLPTLRPNGIDPLTKDDVGRICVVGPITINTIVGYIQFIFVQITDSNDPAYIVTDSATGNHYGWRPLIPHSNILDQRLRQADSPTFSGVTVGSLHVTGGLAIDGDLASGLSAAIQTALKIRTSAPSNPSAGDIYIG